MTTPKIFLLAAVLVLVRPGAAVEPPETRDDIDRLIRQLGSDDFEAREDATQQLAVRDDALPKLRQAAKSEDPEMRWRAEHLVKVITRRLDDKAIQELLGEVGKEGIDRFIDRMVTEKDYATPQCWELAYKFAEAAARASKVSGRQFNVPKLDLSKMDTMTACPEYRSNDMKLQLKGIYPAGKILRQCVVVSSGDCPVTECLDHCVVFVNGDMAGCCVIRDSVLFCNGKLGNVTCVRSSMVFCTGGLEGAATNDDSVFDVRTIGAVTCARNSVYINLNAINAGPGPGSRGNQFIQTDEGPLRLFKLFDPAMMGVELTSVEGGSRVVSVRDGTPFAKAAFQKGDLVVNMDKEPDASTEAIRKYLRRRAAGDEVVFKVRRGDKVIEIKVKITD